MKRIFTILAIAAFGVATSPSFANSWQWQLDQIKADKQRRDRCHAAEQAKLLMEKMNDAQKKAAEEKTSEPASTPPVK